MVGNVEYCKSGYFRAINFSRSANSDEFRGFLISRRVGDHFVKLLVLRPSHRCHTRYTVHNCMWLCAQLTCTRLQRKIFAHFYFRAILVLREMRENFHTAKYSTFTVYESRNIPQRANGWYEINNIYFW